MITEINSFSIADLLRRCAKYYPAKAFFVNEDAKVSYGRLNERVNRLSNALANVGLKKGDHVAFLFQNSPEFIECFFANAKSGVVSIPLNFRLSPREFAYEINQCDAKMLIYDSQYAETIDTIRPQLNKVKTFSTNGGNRSSEVLEYNELIHNSSPAEPTTPVTLDDGCIMYYTAGTTGLPKAAYRTHANVFATIQDSCVSFSTCDDDVWLGFAPWFHIGGWECFALPALLRGSTVVTARAFDQVKFLECIEKEKVTIVFLVPAMIIRILSVPDIDKYDLSSVRKILSGTAPTPEGLKRQLMKYFSNAEYLEGYGMTETGHISVLSHSDALRKQLCAGCSNYSMKIRIVDEHDKDIPVGEIGEIILQGPQVSQGYYNDPVKTAESTKGGWFHSGDLGRMDEEGRLYIVDRKKDMIKSGSENVYGAEVESIIYEHPKILEAAAIGLPDEKWGERVTAVVVLKDGVQMTEEELIEFCRENLAHYKCPKQVIFMSQPLPRTAAGKVRKNELREQFSKDNNMGRSNAAP